MRKSGWGQDRLQERGRSGAYGANGKSGDGNGILDGATSGAGLTEAGHPVTIFYIAF